MVKEEIIDRINSTLRDLTIVDVSDGRRPIYTTWCEGGDGKIRVSEYIVTNK
jgi:hypothetical protein